MRVHLQEPVLALPQLHDLRARPTRPLALAPVHLQDAEAWIVAEGQLRLCGIALPADTEAQLFRFDGFRDAIENRGHQLRIAIGGDRDEDQIVDGGQNRVLCGGAGGTLALGPRRDPLRLSRHGSRALDLVPVERTPVDGALDGPEQYH